MSASDDTTDAVALALARIRLEYGECLMKGLRCEISTHDARLLMLHIDQCEDQNAQKTARIEDLEAKLAATAKAWAARTIEATDLQRALAAVTRERDKLRQAAFDRDHGPGRCDCHTPSGSLT